MTQRILVSKRIILAILGIGERQLSNLVKDKIVIQVEERFDLVLTVQNYLKSKNSLRSLNGIEETNSLTLSNLFGVSDRTIRELAQKV